MININTLVFESSKKIIPWKTGQIIQKIRRMRITDIMKKMKVSFDLENDEPCGDKQDISIEVHHGQYNGKNIFRCQLMKAGGDWEYSVAYFLCQLLRGSVYRFNGKSRLSTYDFEATFFCFIPIDGNRLVYKDGKYIAYTDENYKKDEVPEINDRKCWDQLKQYLEKISAVK